MGKESPRLRTYRHNGQLTIAYQGKDVLSGKPAELTIRSLLAVATMAGPLSAGGCRLNENPLATPTQGQVEPLNQPVSPNPTVIYESKTPRPEKVELPAVYLSEQLLTEGMTKMDSGQPIRYPEKEKSPQQPEKYTDLLSYTAKAWNKDFNTQKPLGSVEALQVLLAYGQKGGVNGTTYHFQETFSGLDGLRFFRYQATNLSAGKVKEIELKGSPEGVILRQNTEMTVIGFFDDYAGQRWALVGFNEGFDRTKKDFQPRDIPRIYLAALPFDQRVGQGVSLTELLTLNDIKITGQFISFSVNGQETAWPINSLEMSLVKKLTKEAGYLWVDKLGDGSWSENPLVPPIPDDLIDQRTLGLGRLVKSGAGQIVFNDSQGRQVLEAVYDKAAKEWKWQKVASPTAKPPEPTRTPVPTVAPEPTRLVRTIIPPVATEPPVNQPTEPPIEAPTQAPATVVPTVIPVKPTPTPKIETPEGPREVWINAWVDQVPLYDFTPEQAERFRRVMKLYLPKIPPKIVLPPEAVNYKPLYPFDDDMMRSITKVTGVQVVTDLGALGQTGDDRKILIHKNLFNGNDGVMAGVIMKEAWIAQMVWERAIRKDPPSTRNYYEADSYLAGYHAFVTLKPVVPPIEQGGMQVWADHCVQEFVSWSNGSK